MLMEIFGLYLVVCPDKFKPYRTSVMLLQEIIKLHRDHFQWKQPPYEYEYKKLPIDLILGSSDVRKMIMNMEKIDSIEKSWESELIEFKERSREFHLYG